MTKYLYHLKNDFNDHNEFTSDDNKIRLLFVDECNQALRNNYEDIARIQQWSDEIMHAVCHNYDTNTLVHKLNKDHNWKIDIYVKVN